MNPQQVLQPKSSANRCGCQTIEREKGSLPEHKLQSGKTNLSRPTNAEAGVSPSRERLLYVLTCLIGHTVEVQVRDGSLFSGIFHATNAEKGFGIILKMASSIRIDTFPGQKNLKTLIIPAAELVQISAKDINITADGMANNLQHVKQHDTRQQ